MFGSDTMMKFNIIKNELHNIMRSQLRRVDGEVTAMAQRIKALDQNLELSEQYIKTATATLAEAVQVHPTLYIKSPPEYLTTLVFKCSKSVWTAIGPVLS